MCTVARAMVSRLQRLIDAPLLVLLIVSVLSLGARALLLDEPCQSPCTTAQDHTMIFDEAYYVNAARVIAGIRPPNGQHYSDAPLGTDPNAEHPQGAKLIMAAAIEIFGDGPFAWRIGSLIMGTIAILGMYALVRSAGGGPRSALCATVLMACDNLLLVHGRIGTLDIYVVAGMIWAVALYLRGRPLLAGLALALAECFKLVAPYILAVLLLVELGRVIVARRERLGPEQEWGWRPALARWLAMGFVSTGVFVGLLGVMGEIAPPYADAEARLITGGPFTHISHMITYAGQQVSVHGPQGIASYPWQWLIDLKPIVYLRINPSLPGQGLYAIHPVSDFLGMINPAIVVVGMPALVFALYRFLRRRSTGSGRGVADVQLAIVSVAWFIGTWTPFAFLSAVDQRTSYIYYMVVVMPGIYLAATYVASLAWRRRRRWLSGGVGAWGLAVLAAAVLMYPFVAAF
jgi:predicted membrane-bound dolichyl-phosphate-mannose-protein mannosyltransferase